MATALTPQTTAASGVVLAAAASLDGTSGNKFVNDGRTMILINNASASSITATFTTTGTYNVGAVAYPIADLTVTVLSSSEKACGPFDKTLFNDSNGDVIVTWSAVTTVTARVIALGTA